MAKTKKKRAEKYDPKLAIKGSFADVIKVSVTNPDKSKEINKKQIKTMTIQDIIDRIEEKDFFPAALGQDKIIALIALYKYFEPEDKDTINKVIRETEYISLNEQGNLVIPAHYFDKKL